MTIKPEVKKPKGSLCTIYVNIYFKSYIKKSDETIRNVLSVGPNKWVKLEKLCRIARVVTDQDCAAPVSKVQSRLVH